MIQSLFQKELDSVWMQLERKYSKKKTLILPALLLIINDLSKSIGESDNESLTADYLRLPILLYILDELLIRKWDSVEHPNPRHIQKYVDIVIREFQAIGRIRNRMIESKLLNEEQILLKNGTTLVDIPSQSDDAFDDWTRSNLLDEDWMEYYYRESSGAHFHHSTRQDWFPCMSLNPLLLRNYATKCMWQLWVMRNGLIRRSLILGPGGYTFIDGQPL